MPNRMSNRILKKANTSSSPTPAQIFNPTSTLPPTLLTPPYLKLDPDPDPDRNAHPRANPARKVDTTTDEGKAHVKHMWCYDTEKYAAGVPIFLEGKLVNDVKQFK